MANPTVGGNPWSSYMVDLYRSRQAPQPLGTVIFEEIEAKAKEKLKDYGGASSTWQLHFYLRAINMIQEHSCMLVEALVQVQRIGQIARHSKDMGSFLGCLSTQRQGAWKCVGKQILYCFSRY